MTTQEPSQHSPAPVQAVDPAPATPTAPAAVPPAGKPKKPFFKKWWFWVIVVIVVIAIAGAAGGGGGKKDTDSAPVQDAASTEASQSGEDEGATDESTEGDAEYTISDEAFVDNGYGSYSVTGTFTNTSGKELSYVQVSYRMLDADGAQVGTAWANTTNLPDGSAWKFDAMYFDSDAAPASFQLAEVSSY